MSITRYMRPSLAATWSKCKGYAALNARLDTECVEETSNDVREDGTACHWLAQEVWEGRQHNVGDLSPNGRELTEEMFAAVAEYHDLLRSHGTQMLLEQQVPVSKYFPGMSDGTPDGQGFDGTTVFIDDLKYGFRPVEVWRCAQLIVYAWTVVCELTRQGHAPQWAELSICQPRCAHRDGTTRTWRVSIGELGELAATLAADAQACYAPNPLCTVGSQCRNCAAARNWKLQNCIWTD